MQPRRADSATARTLQHGRHKAQHSLEGRARRAHGVVIGHGRFQDHAPNVDNLHGVKCHQTHSQQQKDESTREMTHTRPLTSSERITSNSSRASDDADHATRSKSDSPRETAHVRGSATIHNTAIKQRDAHTRTQTLARHPRKQPLANTHATHAHNLSPPLTPTTLHAISPRRPFSSHSQILRLLLSQTATQT